MLNIQFSLEWILFVVDETEQFIRVFPGIWTNKIWKEVKEQGLVHVMRSHPRVDFVAIVIRESTSGLVHERKMDNNWR